MLKIFIFVVTLHSNLCLPLKSASSSVSTLNQNFNESYKDVTIAVSLLNKVLDLESFNNNFEIIILKSESFQFSKNWTQLKNTHLQNLFKSKPNQILYNHSNFMQRRFFLNFQNQFWPSHLNFTLKSSLSSGNRNNLFCSFFTNWIDADYFKNEIENYLNSFHNIHVDVPPYFFIFLILPHTDLKNIETQLENWSKSFDISSQVYLVHLAMTDPNSGNAQSTNIFPDFSVFEFYQVKNKSIVQLVFASQENSADGINLKNKTDDKIFNVKFKEMIKINFLNLLQKKTLQRSNFHQAEIIAGEVDSRDYEANTKYRLENINSTYRQPFFESGFNVLEFWFIRDSLNFSETAVAWPQYIRPGPNGSLAGMAIPVNAGLIDLSIASNEFLEYRASGPDGLSFTQPTFHNPLTVFFKQPSASTFRNIFLETFSTQLWAALIACWILIIFSMCGAQKLKRRVCNTKDRKDAQICRDSWLWAISATCMKGWYSPPHSTPMKIIFVTGIFMAVVVYVAYSAALVSILSVAVVPVKTFRELLDYKFNILSDNHIPTATVTVQILERQNVIPKLPNDERDVLVNQNIKNILTTKVAILSQMDAFYPVVEKQGYKPAFICSTLSYVQYSRRPSLSGWVVKKGSPLRTYFNYKLILMKERGVMNRLSHHYILETTTRCSGEANGFEQQLELNDLFTPFALLFIATLFSIAILGGEKLLGKLQIIRTDESKLSMTELIRNNSNSFL